jgi:hypothetical protein
MFSQHVLILFSCQLRFSGTPTSLAGGITARCAWGKRDAMKSIRECTHSAELDLRTLVWTRGAAFPLADLSSRLKCPRCGSRSVSILFTVPTEPRRTAVGR